MTGVGKGNIRIAKAKVANDAAARLQAIIERLVASGMDGKAAEDRTKKANPELVAMLPDAESLEPAVSNYQPRTR
jgi:hypothetical protein